jgi:hypothetical protein
VARVCRLDGCEIEVEGRRKYCSDEHSQEARRASSARSWLRYGPRYNERRREKYAEDSSEAEVVDYSKPGSHSKPPSFSGVPKGQRKIPTFDPTIDLMVSDGRVSNPRERVPSYDVRALSGADRQDRYNVEREIARQIAAEENDTSSWDNLQAHDERVASSVFFGPAEGAFQRNGRPIPQITRPDVAGTLYGEMPSYLDAAAGNAVQRIRPPQKPPGQKTPHIIV